MHPDARLRLTREEVFGPVVNLVRVADGDEVLRLANETEIGLCALLRVMQCAGRPCVDALV